MLQQAVMVLLLPVGLSNSAMNEMLTSCDNSRQQFIVSDSFVLLNGK
jgi:hypothetical protein